MTIQTRRDALKGAAALSSLLLSSCAERDGGDGSATGGRAFKQDDLTPLEHHGERIAITVMYRAKNSGRNRSLAHTDQFPAVVAMSAVG